MDGAANGGAGAGGSTVPVLTIADAVRIEGDSGRPTLDFLLRLSEPAAHPVEVRADTVSGTAFEGFDVVPLYDRITIPPGATEAVIPVSIDPGSAAEGDETVFLELRDLSGAVFAGGAPFARATGLVLDDDGEDRPALFFEDVTVLEGDGPGLITVPIRLSRPLESDLALWVTIVDLGGTAPVVPLSMAVTIPAGETAVPIPLSVAGDALPGPDAILGLVATGGGAVLSDGAAGAFGRLTIRDDDADDGLPVLSVAPIHQREGDTGRPTLDFVISLTAPAAEDVAFHARTADGTARVGEDYLARDNRIVIPAGATSQRLTVLIEADDRAEGDESLTLEIARVDGAALPGGVATLRATGTILDDDAPHAAPLHLWVADVTAAEPEGADGALRFTLETDAPAAAPVAGRFEVLPGTAEAGADFVPRAGRFEIPAGARETKIDIPLMPDDIAEGAETVVLVLSALENAAGANASDTLYAVGIIEDGPEAVDDIAGVSVETTTAIDALGNDRPGDGGPLALRGVDAPAHGTAFLADGALFYRPDRGFSGVDSFVYTVADGSGARREARVDLLVEPEPGTPAVTRGQAQTVAYLYEAALDRDGAIDLAGLNYWIGRVGEGASLRAVAESFLHNPEFARAFGPPDRLDDVDLVAQLYENVLDRPGDEAGLAHWQGVIARPGTGPSDLLLAFALSPENLRGSPGVAALAEIAPGDWAFL
ncbi:MAG: Calx-beta domain-containing protein [Paracoccaceae bacterium]